MVFGVVSKISVTALCMRQGYFDLRKQVSYYKYGTLPENNRCDSGYKLVFNANVPQLATGPIL